MNISNAVFEFTSEVIAAAGEDTPLYGVQLHADIYEEIRLGKTIRVDDLRSAVPVLTDVNTIEKHKAMIHLMFVAMPETQKLEDRLAARQLTEDMADQWLIRVFNNQSLADPEGNARVCTIGNIVQFNDWIKPGTVKIPVCILKIEVNP